MNRIVVYILAVVAAILLSASVLFAHAKLESSVPAAGSTLEKAPTTVELRFSVGIQSAMSSIRVMHISSGMAVPVGPLETADAGKVVSVRLSNLESGAYRVDWRALSADDHMIDGKFEFQVGTALSDLPPSTPSADHEGMDHSAHESEPAVGWPQSLVRWLIYVGMMLLTGGLGFRLFVADGELSRSETFNGRMIIAVAVGSTLLLFGLLVALALQTRIVMGTINTSSAISILRETSFGLTWMLQAATVLLSLALIVAARTISSFPAKRALFVGAFVLSLITLLGSSLSGHARAAMNEYSFAILSDWLHLAAASIWIGGLFVIAFAIPPVLRGIDPDAANEQLATWIRRFTRLAVPAVILLALTGLYNSWIHVDSFSALIETTYGQVLLTKVLIAGVMVVLGGINGFILQRQLEAGSTGSEGKAGSGLFRKVRVEGLLALAVLLLAALLAFLPPARDHIPVSAGVSATSYQNDN
ncbi:MAG TPA: copper resistance protein CopC [Pyrinomonadaceae bacterium]|nr:copper resistance protein CopC [Pyrinomonadaceae bacterium]